MLDSKMVIAVAISFIIAATSSSLGASMEAPEIQVRGLFGSGGGGSGGSSWLEKQSAMLEKQMMERGRAVSPPRAPPTALMVPTGNNRDARVTAKYVEKQKQFGVYGQTGPMPVQLPAGFTWPPRN